MVKKTYTIKQELVARFANALANPARIAICDFLGKQKSCYFGDVEKVIPLSKATVSQHLTVLKEAGLVEGESHPPRVLYSINKENWNLARNVLYMFMESCVDDPKGSDNQDSVSDSLDEPVIQQ